MKKIVVTSDLSLNSKAALRFAGQLAAQDEIALVILQVVCVNRPISWHEAAYAAYEKSELTKAEETLDRFIASVYQNLDITSPAYTPVVKNSAFTDTGLFHKNSI